jgi:hypothetical protein
MKRFVMRKYKLLYQPHALHPLIHIFVRSVQPSGGGLDTSGYKSHNHLCPWYFNNILHNMSVKNDYFSRQKYKSFPIWQNDLFPSQCLTIVSFNGAISVYIEQGKTEK